MIVRCLLISMGIGVVVELVARLLQLWLYRGVIYPVLNVLLVFGVVMGGLAAAIRSVGSIPPLALAFAVGLAYEAANLQWLHWWNFPDEWAATARGRTALVVGLGVLWAVVPLVTVQAEARLRRLSLRPSPPSRVEQFNTKLEQLDEREKQLLQKLDQLQQRTRDVTVKLEDVRERRQRLLDKQAVHQPGRRATTPTP